MKSVQNFLLIAVLGVQLSLSAQYQFTVDLEDQSIYQVAYLSLVEDYRKIAGVYEDQIIKQVAIEDGLFRFEGDNLDARHRIYRIHVDNCSNLNEKGHFNGQCQASRSVIFIASNTDTIRFPVAFEDQVLCDIESGRTHNKALARVDSIKEQMTFDYLSYRSSTNKRINDKNWFAKLKQFGLDLEEPLAELYIYQFLSDRRSDFYDSYLEDLVTSTYYEELLTRLNMQYPGAPFTKQYESDLAADRYKINYNINGQKFEEVTIIIPWWLIALILLAIVVALLAFLYFRQAKKRAKKQPAVSHLTQQEQRVLELLLENKTNKEIAQEIFVSVSTVKSHTNNLYKKLKVTSRDEVKKLFSTLL